MKNNINLKFHKINIRIESSISEFVEFITQYFHNQVNHKDNDESDILIKFEKVNKDEYDDLIRSFKKGNDFSQLSRSIFCNNSSVLFTDIEHFPGLLLSFRLEKTNLEIFGYYYQQKTIINYLTQLLSYDNNNLKLYLYLKYYLILFPIIFYYLWIDILFIPDHTPISFRIFEYFTTGSF